MATDSKDAVNRHFASVTELHRTMGYIGNLSIEDVLKSVLMATLKASTNRSLRDAYHFFFLCLLWEAYRDCFHVFLRTCVDLRFL
jgi:hypothetical protein